jgi:glycosyltransferase involved in cell wall biosynthesis
MNVIASQRTLGYANHFRKFGFEPTILTHQWDKSKEEQHCKPNEILGKTIIEENGAYSVYKMPIGQFKRGKIISFFENSRLNKINILFMWIMGHLDTKGELLNSSLTEKHFLTEHLKTNNYDVVLGVFSPHFHLKNCYWINKKFKIPYVLDYRDLWNNRIIHQKYTPNAKLKFQDKITSFWWRVWAKKALLNTITSEPWRTKLQNIGVRKTAVITNGFEKNEFVFNTNDATKEFKIVHTGSLYNNQDLTAFFNAVNIFINKINPLNFKIYFIGAERNKKVKYISINSFIDAQTLKDKYRLSEEYFVFSPRTSREDSLKQVYSASILLMPTFPFSPGTYSGKIFEYLPSKRPILATPKDLSVIDELIQETQTGICSSIEDEIVEFLTQSYNDWIKKGFVIIEGKKEKIDYYSRENQTKILADLIGEKIKQK